MLVFYSFSLFEFLLSFHTLSYGTIFLIRIYVYRCTYVILAITALGSDTREIRAGAWMFFLLAWWIYSTAWRLNGWFPLASRRDTIDRTQTARCIYYRSRMGYPFEYTRITLSYTQKQECSFSPDWATWVSSMSMKKESLSSLSHRADTDYRPFIIRGEYLPVYAWKRSIQYPDSRKVSDTRRESQSDERKHWLFHMTPERDDSPWSVCTQ